MTNMGGGRAPGLSMEPENDTSSQSGARGLAPRCVVGWVEWVAGSSKLGVLSVNRHFRGHDN